MGETTTESSTIWHLRDQPMVLKRYFCGGPRVTDPTLRWDASGSLHEKKTRLREEWGGMWLLTGNCLRGYCFLGGRDCETCPFGVAGPAPSERDRGGFPVQGGARLELQRLGS